MILYINVVNIHKFDDITAKGRTVKPLLMATPVRASPKSTPRLKPPRHDELRCRRMAFGGICSSHGTETGTDSAAVTNNCVPLRR